MTTIGYLHTAEIHVPAFSALAAELIPEAGAVHLVDEELLSSFTEAALRARLDHLADAGCDLILCTCSTIGGRAEQAGARVPVIRLDRPMADAAIATGGRITVVAAVPSTIGPTLALFGDTPVTTSICPGAWDDFQKGQLRTYADRIARHCRTVAPESDVIVLAQASMAPAAALLADLPIPVLTSPRRAVEHLRHLLRE